MTAVETLTYTAAEVATVLGYFHGNGKPNVELVRHLVRKKTPQLPPPINLNLGPKLWRWSIPVIEACARGEWSPT